MNVLLELLITLILAFAPAARPPQAITPGPSLLGLSSQQTPAVPAAPAAPEPHAPEAPSSGTRRLRVTFVDGNTGMVLETPAGKTYVIDPGGKASFERRMAPFLRSRGITRVDAVAITHPHGDHYEGLRYRDGGKARGLLEEFQVGELLDAADLPNEDTDHYLKVIGTNDRSPTRRSGLRQGQSLDWDPALKVEVLSPPKHLFSRAACAARAGYDTLANWTNESSLVLKVTHGEVSFLFTGDIHDLGMAYLIDQAHEVTVKESLVVDGKNIKGKKLRARPNPSPIRGGDIDVLALPHHGVGRAEYAPFRDTVRAQVTIAPNDRRQFKSAEKQANVRWWDTPSTDLYWTAPEVDGLVTVVSNGSKFQVKTKDSNRKVTYDGTPRRQAAAR
jgi:competence protein ComEC